MSTPLDFLLNLHELADRGASRGLTSVCSAHPLVIEAALIEAHESGSVACIEATCNQVNQDGGYTGMTPSDFRAYVISIAAVLGFPESRILFGGDHLGPNPWRHMPAEDAMQKAEAMTYAYARAGFGKIHLDASMTCGGDESPLPVATIAQRAVRLAQASERGALDGMHPAPAYIVGTEVPIPGGAMEALDRLSVTSPSDAEETLAVHRAKFCEAGLEDVLARVCGLVVQPGVEFGNANVIRFNPDEAKSLSEWRNGVCGLVFEAHSTDYQPTPALKALVEGGFCILKVGPGLSFAMREALYGLDHIAGMLSPGYESGSLGVAMEQAMLGSPKNWDAYYHGNAEEKQIQRHFSYSDRIRYYWNVPEVKAAVDRLFAAFGDHELPETMVSQYLARVYPEVSAGTLESKAKPLVIAAIRKAIRPYTIACGAVIVPENDRD